MKLENLLAINVNSKYFCKIFTTANQIHVPYFILSYFSNFQKIFIKRNSSLVNYFLFPETLQIFLRLFDIYKVLLN